MTDYNEAIKNLQTVHGMPMTIRLAIEALEKQIPKKPHKNRSEYFCHRARTLHASAKITGTGTRQEMIFASAAGRHLIGVRIADEKDIVQGR